MTTDLTQPQAELGPAPANGSGQTQGHRRRRRRRKNKSSQQSGMQAQPGQQAKPQQPAAPQAHTPAPRQAQPQQNQGRKKKFFQKSQAPQAGPGNSIHGPSQGKRRGKQKGPREFVGPMDHSYRAINGNVPDGPPSTIQITSNGHGSPYQDAYVQPAPAPMRED